jgi:hypothetical protein
MSLTPVARLSLTQAGSAANVACIDAAYAHNIAPAAVRSDKGACLASSQSPAPSLSELRTLTRVSAGVSPPSNLPPRTLLTLSALPGTVIP